MKLLRNVLGVGAALCLAACSGSVDNRSQDDEDDEPEDDAPDEEDDGGSGGGGRGGSGGGTVTGTDPGTVAIRRLNATEYNNTVRDLLGTSKRPADDFGVGDKAAFGFDNNANALDVDLANLTSYSGAAETLVSEVLSTPALKSKIFTCDPAMGGDTCAKTIVSSLARRAYRRPVEDAEVTGLMGLVKVARDKGDSYDVGIGLAIEAMLSSPNFLFRIETDADPTSTKPRNVTSHEMASRLSYFLWSTMPDAELFSAADDDKLKDARDIEAQVDRMLKDGKAAGLVTSFGDLWIPNRLFVDHEVDTGIFPKFTPELRTAMLGETQALLKDLFSGAIGFDGFLTADYTYVNDVLADHYGLPKPGSTTHKKVTLPAGSNRRGFLTHGTFLTATSQPGTTSIVRRGRYVFENLLCGEVAEPQNGVPQFDSSGGGTLREKFERHRADPQCRACHEAIDPPGFVLESYDAVGAYRTKDNGATIDPSGDLQTEAGVVKVKDTIEMGETISKDDGYARCVTKALYAFALGRGPEPDDGGGDMDESVLENLQGTLKSSGWKFTDMARAIVASKPFRMRRPNQGVQP